MNPKKIAEVSIFSTKQAEQETDQLKQDLNTYASADFMAGKVGYAGEHLSTCGASGLVCGAGVVS